MKTDEHLYTLTRLEFAKTIGKSKEAVKIAMKRGKFKDLYIFKNGQYYFKTREAVRENKTLSPLEMYPAKKSKVRRGGHEMAVKKGRYPNTAFAEHNHMKKMIALRGKLSPEELAMVPDVERLVKQEREKRLREEYEAKLPPRDDTRGRPFKSYTSGLINYSNKGYGTPQYHSPNADDYSPSKFRATNRGKRTDETRDGWGPFYW